MVKQDVLSCEWSTVIHQPGNQALKGMQLLQLLRNLSFIITSYTPVQNFQYHLN